MNNVIDVYIKIENEGKEPVYSSEHAAGCDLFATEDMIILPGETKIMPLNFIIALEPEMEAQIRPRSGLSLKTDLRIPNGPGTIDSDYRNVVGVILQNTYSLDNLPYQIVSAPEILTKLINDYREITLNEYLELKNINIQTKPKMLDVLNQRVYIDIKNNPYGTIYINKGERIAQMVFAEYKKARFLHHPSPEKIGYDRGGGFGHTGIKE